MASNPNTKLRNRSTFYAARSGGGKAQAIIQNKEIGPRRVLWDPDNDYRVVTRVEKIGDFIRALREQHTKARFSIAYSGDPSPAAFEIFCGAVWAVLDGRKIIDIIVDELADCVETTGKARPKAGQLMRRARKYGGVLHLSTQRPQEVPKTLFRTCTRFWIGVQDPADQKPMSKVAGVAEADLAVLDELQFWVKESGKDARHVTLIYQKP